MNRRRFLVLSGLVAPASVLPEFTESAHAASELVVVPVVAKTSPMHGVTLAFLERVFLGQPAKDDAGQRVVPFNHLPNTAERSLFDRRVLRMNPDEAARYWVDQRIRGNGRAPKTVPRTDLLKKVVSQFPGAISYLAASELDDQVRPLQVNGLAWSAPNYPIR